MEHIATDVPPPQILKESGEVVRIILQERIFADVSMPQVI